MLNIRFKPSKKEIRELLRIKKKRDWPELNGPRKDMLEIPLMHMT